MTSVCLVLAALCDAPTRIRLGAVTDSISASALLTVFVGSLCAVSLPAMLSPIWRLRPVIPLWLFVGWAALIAATKGVDTAGAQNLIVFGTFASAITCTAAWCDDAGAATVTRWLRHCGWLIAIVYGASVILEGVGASSLLGRRSFGMAALVFLALSVPEGSKGGRVSRALPWVLFLLVALSLSKTATAVAALLLAVRVAHGRVRLRPVRALAMALGIGLAIVWAVSNVSMVNERVFGGDRAYAVGGLTLNTEGRTALWSAVSRDIQTSPFFGHGAGAANTLVAETTRSLDQPHNDYLRVVYDYGYVGLALFALAYLSLIWATGRRARRRRHDLSAAAPHTAAALGLVAVAIGMTTDNVLVYGFVMAPLGVMIGLSLRQPLSDPASGDTVPSTGGADTGRLNGVEHVPARLHLHHGDLSDSMQADRPVRGA